MWSKLSQYYIWHYDNRVPQLIIFQNHNWQPFTSPSWVSYGMSIVEISEKISLLILFESSEVMQSILFDADYGDPSYYLMAWCIQLAYSTHKFHSI